MKSYQNLEDFVIRQLNSFVFQVPCKPGDDIHIITVVNAHLVINNTAAGFTYLFCQN